MRNCVGVKWCCVQTLPIRLRQNLFFKLDDLGGLQPSSFRGRCFRLCHSKYWDLVIAFVIGVNVILMSLEHYRMSEKYKLLLEVNNYVCTGIFVIEAFVKLTAVGWRCYFYDRCCISWIPSTLHFVTVC